LIIINHRRRVSIVTLPVNTAVGSSVVYGILRARCMPAEDGGGGGDGGGGLYYIKIAADRRGCHPILASDVGSDERGVGGIVRYKYIIIYKYTRRSV